MALNPFDPRRNWVPARIAIYPQNSHWRNNLMLGQNSNLVDYDIFMNVRRLDAQDVSSLQKLYKAAEFDFRLKPASAAVDRGVALPNVTDSFAGRAPDLGALEVDAAAPHYGPRP